MAGFVFDPTPRAEYVLPEDLSQCTYPALIRLKKDIEEAGPLPPTVALQYPGDQDPFLVLVTLCPEEGYYAGGTFTFLLTFKKTYPIDPPRAKCLSTVHKGVPTSSPDGAVCLNILRLDWSPVLSLSSVIFGLLMLFYEPSADDPLNQNAAKVLQSDPAEFAACVKKSMQGQTLSDGIPYDRVLL